MLIFKHLHCVQVGLSGEMNKIYTLEGSSRAQWTAIDKSMHLPLIWYKVQQMYTSPGRLQPHDHSIVTVTDSLGKLLLFDADNF